MYERFLEGWDILFNVAIALGAGAAAIVAFFVLLYALGWAWTITVGLYGLARDKIEKMKALTG